MPTTRVTTTRRVGRKPPVTEITGANKTKASVISGLASQPADTPAIDSDTQRMMIAEAAYYRAEKRAFAPGGELEDWLEAEAQIHARLRP